MESLAIRPHFNKGKDRLPGLGPGPKGLVVEPFDFHRVKKGLHGGIIPAVAFTTHGGHEPVLGEQGLVVGTGVLAAPVGMVQHARRGMPTPHGIGQRLAGQRPVDPLGHRPAHDAPKGEIHHGGQIEPAFAGGNVGDIARPHLMGCGGRELAGQPILGDRIGVRRVRGDPKCSAVLGGEAVLAHHAGDPVLTARFSLLAQRGMNARTAIGLLTRGMRRLNVQEQAAIQAHADSSYGA